MRAARLRAGIKSGAAAAHAGVSAGTLSKYEKAENPWPVSVVHILTEFYGLAAEDREQLTALARQQELGWWHRLHDGIPAWFEAHIGLESEAESIAVYEDGLVTGLLQTPDYARAVLAADVDAGPADHIDAQVAVRMRRQQRLIGEDPLSLDVVLNEAALHREVGGPGAMAGQLRALLEAAQRPNVDLRVLAFEAGAHAAGEGSFALMRFPRLLAGVDFGDVVAVEYRAGALYLEDDAETALFTRIFDRVRDHALDPGASIDRIHHLLSERYRR
ncbi:DUF5753 domain-containing protein [Nocardiopsis trehalosi]|jgi:hypothetical protein|uniref:DUF5753 domain-containing protein n=1 Tax=Nocardiopsis trehalosi TaxID=109329 RepID=UPI00083002A6|nr:DUF5753 domain-containing protein [Nocardiopsis trehalosi]